MTFLAVYISRDIIVACNTRAIIRKCNRILSVENNITLNAFSISGSYAFSTFWIAKFTILFNSIIISFCSTKTGTSIEVSDCVIACQACSISKCTTSLTTIMTNLAKTKILNIAIIARTAISSERSII